MNISELIISLLNKHQCVALRKVGSFHIDMNDPIIDEENNTIAPSLQVLQILPIQDGDPELVSTALVEGLITEEQATELRILTGLKALELSRHNEVHIEGLGRVVSSLTKGVSFIPLVTLTKLLSPHSPYLPIVDLPKERLVNTREREAVSPKSKPQSDDHLKAQSPLKEDKVLDDLDKKVELEAVTYSSDAKKEEVVRKSSVGIKLNQKKSSFYKDYGLPLVLFVVGILMLAFIFKTCLPTSDKIPAKGEVPLGFDRAPDDLDPLTKSGDGIFNNPLLNKYKNILTQEIIDSGCQIVVGTFGDEENARSLASSLSSDGYNISLIEHQQQTRVVLAFDCSQHDLDEYYQEVRKNISPNAWYLVPKYEPEK